MTKKRKICIKNWTRLSRTPWRRQRILKLNLVLNNGSIWIKYLLQENKKIKERRSFIKCLEKMLVISSKRNKTISSKSFRKKQQISLILAIELKSSLRLRLQLLQKSLMVKIIQILYLKLKSSRVGRYLLEEVLSTSFLITLS